MRSCITSDRGAASNPPRLLSPWPCSGAYCVVARCNAIYESNLCFDCRARALGGLADNDNDMYCSRSGTGSGVLESGLNPRGLRARARGRAERWRPARHHLIAPEVWRLGTETETEADGPALGPGFSGLGPRASVINDCIMDAGALAGATLPPPLVYRTHTTPRRRVSGRTVHTRDLRLRPGRTPWSVIVHRASCIVHRGYRDRYFTAYLVGCPRRERELSCSARPSELGRHLELCTRVQSHMGPGAACELHAAVEVAAAIGLSSMWT